MAERFQRQNAKTLALSTVALCYELQSATSRLGYSSLSSVAYDYPETDEREHLEIEPSQAIFESNYQKPAFVERDLDPVTYDELNSVYGSAAVSHPSMTSLSDAIEQGTSHTRAYCPHLRNSLLRRDSRTKTKADCPKDFA
ncbi:hypothetical protein N7478_001041 [Penicillium angulare]|uniref:uncharacterized protein n=1 Tax=Penicillium angulare TaxID=116970 RepID=UPI002540D505|nr:uncharacterized protein N7478_001041 [Penicillium angulare]KAJ5291790.1 hypothetical protein N7478_001041 [Penicillium angulare]